MGFPGRVRKRRRSVGAREMPGDMEKKREVQDRREVPLCDR